jgi:hypothetical protein
VLPGLLVPSRVFTGKHVDCPVVTRHTQQGGVLVEVDAVDVSIGSSSPELQQ